MHFGASNLQVTDTVEPGMPPFHLLWCILYAQGSELANEMPGVTIWNVSRAHISPSVHTPIYRRDITPAGWCFNASYQFYWTHLMYILTFIEGVPPLAKIFHHIYRNRELWGMVMGDWFSCHWFSAIWVEHNFVKSQIAHQHWANAGPM